MSSQIPSDGVKFARDLLPDECSDEDDDEGEEVKNANEDNVQTVENEDASVIMPRKRNLSKTLSTRTRSAVKRSAEAVDPPREQIAFRRGPPPKNAKVIDGNDQTDGIAGLSATHQQRNVTELYQSPTKFELELENRLLKAQLMQREMMDEINGLKMKVAKMEQQQKKEDDLVGQIQVLKDEQKKCLDKYKALEKELARKYTAKAAGKEVKVMKERGQQQENTVLGKQNASAKLLCTEACVVSMTEHGWLNKNNQNDIKAQLVKLQLVKSKAAIPSMHDYKSEFGNYAAQATALATVSVGEAISDDADFAGMLLIRAGRWYRTKMTETALTKLASFDSAQLHQLLVRKISQSVWNEIFSDAAPKTIPSGAEIGFSKSQLLIAMAFANEFSTHIELFEDVSALHITPSMLNATNEVLMKVATIGGFGCAACLGLEGGSYEEEEEEDFHYLPIVYKGGLLMEI